MRDDDSDQNNDARLAAVIIGLLLCFGLGTAFGRFVGIHREPPREPLPASVVHQQQRHACMREQHAVVSQWRLWTERAAAAGECRGHVLMNGDEP